MDPLMLQTLAQRIKDAVIAELRPEVHQLHQDMTAGAATVHGLQQQLRQLSAEMDSLVRNARQASEGTKEDEEELTLAASVASQQASLAADMERSMRRPSGPVKASDLYGGDIVPRNRAATYPSSLALTPNAHLDIKYIGNLVSCNSSRVQSSRLSRRS
jgi:TolA-binding protein